MLTQDEADELIAMGKSFVNPTLIYLPAGVDKSHELLGDDGREQFHLDLYRGTIKLTKVKYQTRARKHIVLIRLEVDGAPHTNPDGNNIGGTHLHRYQEGFEDKWAMELDPYYFGDPADMRQTFEDFCRYCNIREAPQFVEVGP